MELTYRWNYRRLLLPPLPLVAAQELGQTPVQTNLDVDVKSEVRHIILSVSLLVNINILEGEIPAMASTMEQQHKKTRDQTLRPNCVGIEKVGSKSEHLNGAFDSSRGCLRILRVRGCCCEPLTAAPAVTL
ncbi:methyl-accepting chemotaxis protein [Striga asiatica]|uniref:Methyl-accepting chemotaxis protein n=1 Tax=Striga asiatica TaxID=4170 RepID=A0A5A7P3K5_STRAF|nr:methyl-accepting chemotaxis protein [Striga asiatica]